jgi:hypothetical protein
VDGNKLSITFFGIGKELKINKEPYVENGYMVMTLDGIKLTKE